MGAGCWWAACGLHPAGDGEGVLASTRQGTILRLLEWLAKSGCISCSCNFGALDCDSKCPLLPPLPFCCCPSILVPISLPPPSLLSFQQSPSSPSATSPPAQCCAATRCRPPASLSRCCGRRLRRASASTHPRPRCLGWLSGCAADAMYRTAYRTMYRLIFCMYCDALPAQPCFLLRFTVPSPCSSLPHFQHPSLPSLPLPPSSSLLPSLPPTIFHSSLYRPWPSPLTGL